MEHHDVCVIYALVNGREDQWTELGSWESIQFFFIKMIIWDYQKFPRNFKFNFPKNVLKTDLKFSDNVNKCNWHTVGNNKKVEPKVIAKNSSKQCCWYFQSLGKWFLQTHGVFDYSRRNKCLILFIKSRFKFKSWI